MSKKLNMVESSSAGVDEGLAAATYQDGDDALKAVSERLRSGNLNKTDIDVTQGSGVTSYGKAETEADLYARETSIGTKSTDCGDYSIIEDGKRVDESLSGEGDSELIGGRVTDAGDGKLRYQGYLGDFEYDPDQWAVGYRTVKDEFNNVETTVPVLRYVGGKKSGDDIVIPNGVEILDYAFEGNEKLKTVPLIPEGVTSAHCAFANCTKLERACEAAKEGEFKDGDKWAWGLGAAAAAGGTILGAAAVGAATGTVVPVVGNIVGGVGGLIVGVGTVAAGAGAVYGAANDGKGGTWELPKSLEDGSYMFVGCSKLKEAFKEATEEHELINAQGMYADTVSMGTEKFVFKNPVGGFLSAGVKDANAVMDLTDSKVSKTASEDMYSGTNVEITPALEDGNYSEHWNEQTQKLEGGSFTDQEREQVEDLNVDLKGENVLDGKVVTDMTAVTAGAAGYGTQHTRDGDVYTTDANAEHETGGVDPDSGVGKIVGLLDKCAVSYGEYKLVSMALNATIMKKHPLIGKVLSAGITFGGQSLGLLPSSVKPILEGVSDFVGEDSTIGVALKKVSGFIPDTSAVEKMKVQVDEQDKSEKDSSDKTLATADARINAIMSDPLYSAHIVSTDSMVDYMDVNSRLVVQDGVLLSCANKSASDEEFKLMESQTLLAANAMEEKIESMRVADGGELSEAHKQQIAEMYMRVMRGFDSYDDAARDEMARMYPGDQGKQDQAMNGLSKVMFHTVNPMIESMKDMNAMYNLFDEEQIAELDSMKIAGISDSYSDYVENVTGLSAQESVAWGKQAQATPQPAVQSTARQVAAAQPSQPSGQVQAAAVASSRRDGVDISNIRTSDPSDEYGLDPA